MMVLTTRLKGRQAEQAAADYLRSRGWRVVAENYVTPVGEIDLIAQDGGTLVMVEVKARSGSMFGDALEAVGPRKERRLRAAAAWWMAEKGQVTRQIRFDVITISLGDEGSLLSLSHLPDVLGSGR